jgi:hypothetical protein
VTRCGDRIPLNLGRHTEPGVMERTCQAVNPVPGNAGIEWGKPRTGYSPLCIGDPSSSIEISNSC